MKLNKNTVDLIFMQKYTIFILIQQNFPTSIIGEKYLDFNFFSEYHHDVYGEIDMSVSSTGWVKL